MGNVAQHFRSTEEKSCRESSCSLVTHEVVWRLQLVKGLEGHWLEKMVSECWDESVELERRSWELTELPR